MQTLTFFGTYIMLYIRKYVRYADHSDIFFRMINPE